MLACVGYGAKKLEAAPRKEAAFFADGNNEYLPQSRRYALNC
jgi:hypothetical protein